ncbi:MAG TPA: GNAT family N-acetyltransferase [Chloroflexota bacterium]|nr:GNAT family N-acetyltransferase [Chloroflexota bacterium]
MPDCSVHMRPATAVDYEAVAQVMNAVQPTQPVTADELRSRDERRDPICRFARWVAEVNEQVIACAHYTQYIDMYQPGKFWLSMGVLPRWQRQGVGCALYAALLADLQQWQPVTLQTQAAEDSLAACAFLEKQGFVEYGRRWESYLDVAGFDARPYGDFSGQLAEQGIILRAYNELADDPQREEKLYEIQWALDQDVPSLDPITRMSLAQFRQQVVANPTFVPDGTFVALHGSDYVGMSSFFVNQGDNSLVIDLTGTRRDYRRRGIALALKLQGILFAQRNGYARIIVTNDTANQGMLAINAKLGFTRRPAMIQYRRHFEQPHDE